MSSIPSGRGPRFHRGDNKVDLFRMTLHSGIEVCVPNNEVLTEFPNHANIDDFISVNTQQGQRWVHRGRMFQEQYFTRFQGPAYERVEDRIAEQNKAWKDVKEQQKSTIERYKRDHEKAERRAEEAEKEREALRKDLKAWRAAYSTLSKRAERLEYEGDRDYHLRIVAELKAKEEVGDMASKVMEMQSGMEETRIAEADLVSDFKALCFKISGCMQMLNFHIPDERKSLMEELRKALDFDNPATIELSFIDNALKRDLLARVLTAVEADYTYGLAQWSTVKQDVDGNDSLIAMLRVEKDMRKRIYYLRTPDEQSNGKQSAKQQKAAAAARAENLHAVQAFYRWRSDTTRIQALLHKPESGVRRADEEAAERMTVAISEEFFAFLVQAIFVESEVPPWSIFVQEGVSVPEAEKKYQSFQYKVKGCIETAMQLFNKMRSARAHYTFDWIKTSEFKRSVMEVIEEQRSPIPEKIFDRLRNCDLKVVYCVFPSFVKFGDDYGQDYHRQKILRLASVVVEGLPAVDRRSREETDNEGSGEETTALPVRSSQASRRSAETNGHKVNSNGHESNGRRAESQNSSEDGGKSKWWKIV